jgi:hypothetical protein
MMAQRLLRTSWVMGIPRSARATREARTGRAVMGTQRGQVGTHRAHMGMRTGPAIQHAQKNARGTRVGMVAAEAIEMHERDHTRARVRTSAGRRVQRVSTHAEGAGMPTGVRNRAGIVEVANRAGTNTVELTAVGERAASTIAARGAGRGAEGGSGRKAVTGIQAV